MGPDGLLIQARRLANACIAAFGLSLAMAGVSLAQDEDPGHFEVRSGSHELTDGTYFVDAQIYLRLSTDASAALHSRLPLTIRIEVEFLNRLRLWWDPVEFDASRRSQLTFYPLTDRYVVTHIDSGVREDFVTLAGALEFVGRVDRLPVVDAAFLDRDRRYDVRIRAVLDKDDLPGPLRLLAFWRRDWSIASDWLQWRLDEE